MPKKIISEALDRDFTIRRESKIAGYGLFAKRTIPKGARIIEYKGKRKELIQLLEEEYGKEINVYIFALSAGIVIDGADEGNDARFINHSCEPNCEAYAFDDKVFIYASREINVGEELTFDYKLRYAIGGEGSPDSNSIPCNCGAAKCRRTILGHVR